MKSLIILAALLICAVAHAQNTTNIALSVTVTVPGVSTNTTSGTLNYSNAGDKNLISGLAWIYQKARDNGYTNRFDRYIGQVRILDDAKAVADAYNQEQHRLLLEKLTSLLTINISLLSTQNLADLQAIADLAP